MFSSMLVSKLMDLFSLFLKEFTFQSKQKLSQVALSISEG